MSGQFFSRADIVKTAERRKERKLLLERRQQQAEDRENTSPQPPPTSSSLPFAASNASSTSDASNPSSPPKKPLRLSFSSRAPPRNRRHTDLGPTSDLSAAVSASASAASATSTATTANSSTKSSTTSAAPKAQEEYEYWAPVSTEHLTPSVAFSWSTILSSMPGISTSTETPASTPASGSTSISTSTSPPPTNDALFDRISKFGTRAPRAPRPPLSRSTSVSAVSPPPTDAPSASNASSASTNDSAASPAEAAPVAASVLSRVSDTFGPPASRRDVARLSRANSVAAVETNGTASGGGTPAPEGVAAAADPQTAEAAAAPQPLSPEQELLEQPLQAAVLSRVAEKFGPPARRKELYNLGVVRTPTEEDDAAAAAAATAEENEAAATVEVAAGGNQRRGSIHTSTEEARGAEAAEAAPAPARKKKKSKEEELLLGKSAAPYLKHFRKKKLPKSVSLDESSTPPTPSTEASTPDKASSSGLRKDSVAGNDRSFTGDAASPASTAASAAGGAGNSLSRSQSTPDGATAAAPAAALAAAAPAAAEAAAMSNREAAINRSRKSVCPNEKCKALNSYLSFKCINCGTRLGQLVSCKGCGTTVNETAGHCGKCGSGVATRAEIEGAPVLDLKNPEGAGVTRCPHVGCKTITHPSWKFCSTCGRNLKPPGPDSMGPPAHMESLVMESEDAEDLMEENQGPPPAPEELITASIAGNTRKVIDLLLRGVPVNHLDEHGISALNYACWNARFNVVRVLTAFDADLNLRESRGYTALHAACDRSKSEALMEFLVKHGADLAGRGDMGESILHHAAAGGNVSGINFAVRHGIDVNDRDNEGATPLCYAALCDEIEPLEYLLSNGADINAKRDNGQTILHRAVQYRKTACLKFAIEKGLKVCDRDDEGRSALDIAYSTRAPQKIIAFLREAFRTELERCSFCEESPAHIQFHPCHHQYACADCCTRWKKCKCGKGIEKKVDVILDTKGESGKVQEDDSKRIAEELAQLQLEKEKFAEEKTCAVCMDRPKAIVFDCGHTTCTECSTKMRLCHSCRKPIAKKIKFY